MNRDEKRLATEGLSKGIHAEGTVEIGDSGVRYPRGTMAKWAIFAENLLLGLEPHYAYQKAFLTPKGEKLHARLCKPRASLLMLNSDFDAYYADYADRRDKHIQKYLEWSKDKSSATLRRAVSVIDAELQAHENGEKILEPGDLTNLARGVTTAVHELNNISGLSSPDVSVINNPPVVFVDSDDLED